MLADLQATGKLKVLEQMETTPSQLRQEFHTEATAGVAALAGDAEAEAVVRRLADSQCMMCAAAAAGLTAEQISSLLTP
jgi:methylphosphotriester-DNA--protein-cysteine methyltransferase